MPINRDFKVGLAVFLALVFLGGLVFITGGALFRHGGASYEILFPDAMGLEEGAPVYVSGVESGAVRSLRLDPKGVIVTLTLDSSVRIPRDSRVLIGTGGLLGKPLLRVDRGNSSQFYAPGETIPGKIPPDFDSIMEELRDNLKSIKITFGHFNELFGDPERKAKLGKALDALPDLVEESRSAMRQIGGAGNEVKELTRQARLQVKNLSGSITTLAHNLDEVVMENKEDIRTALSSLGSLLSRLDSAFAQFDSDGMSGADLRKAVKSITAAADGIAGVSRNLEGLLEDSPDRPGTPQSTVRSLKKAIKSTEKLVSTIESIESSGEASIHYRSSAAPAEADWLMDVSFLVGKSGSPWGFLVGANDLGNGANGTASVAYRTAWGRVWAGLVRGDVGAGTLIDLRGAKLPLSVSAEWWDDQGGSWAARGKWHVNTRWGLFYERLEPGRDSPRDSFGVFYQF